MNQTISNSKIIIGKFLNQKVSDSETFLKFVFELKVISKSNNCQFSKTLGFETILNQKIVDLEIFLTWKNSESKNVETIF